MSFELSIKKYFFSHPDEIKARTISSRLNKGNKDLTGQVGQADPHRMTQTKKGSRFAGKKKEKGFGFYSPRRRRERREIYI